MNSNKHLDNGIRSSQISSSSRGSTNLKHLFMKKSGKFHILVYVDILIVVSDNESMINELKETLDNKFKIKNLRSLKCFLGIEVAKSRKGIYICQRKYKLDLLKDACVLVVEFQHYHYS